MFLQVLLQLRTCELAATFSPPHAAAAAARFSSQAPKSSVCYELSLDRLATNMQTPLLAHSPRIVATYGRVELITRMKLPFIMFITLHASDELFDDEPLFSFCM
jgi:hypothetical protein